MAVIAAGAAVAVRMSNKAAPAAAAVSQVTVSANKPEIGSVALTSEFIGTVEPDQQVLVFPKVSGTVLHTYFEVGQPVKAGDLLYEVDPVDIQLAYDAAQAKLEASRIEAQQRLGSGYDSSLIALQSQLDAAQTQLNSARSSLRNYNDGGNDLLVSAQKREDQIRAEMSSLNNEIDRLDSMSNEQIAEKYDGKTRDAAYDFLTTKLNKLEQDYSLAHANVKDIEDDDDPTLRSLRTVYKNAQIAYDAAKNAYDLAAGTSRDDTQVTVDAGLHAAEVALEAQAKQLEYTRIYAPISGIIEQKNVSEHDLTSVSQPAYTVSNKSLMTVQFSVSQTAIANLAVGDSVQVENAGKTVQGTITEISTMVDPQSGGLFTVKASVDQTDMPLYTGAIVKLYADTEKATDSILVPSDSVYYDGEKPYLYVYKEGAAVKTEVETGISDMKNIQIISGITAEDEVITTWHPRLLDGAAVVLKDSDAQASSSESAIPES